MSKVSKLVIIVVGALVLECSIVAFTRHPASSGSSAAYPINFSQGNQSVSESHYYHSEPPKTFDQKNQRWGLCDPFQSPVNMKRAAISNLDLTVFFLGCSVNLSAGSFTLTVFMEPSSPIANSTQAVQSKNWEYVSLFLRVAKESYDADEDALTVMCSAPKWHSEAISTFECQAANPAQLQQILSLGEAQVRIWTENPQEAVPPAVSLDICRMGIARQGVELCVPYVPSEGPDMSAHIREYIEYHRIIGISSIIVFDYAARYKTLFEEWYEEDSRVTRVQWKPLSNSPEIVKQQKGSLWERYDLEPLVTYYMVNSNYAWSMVLNIDEYFWSEEFAEAPRVVTPVQTGVADAEEVISKDFKVSISLTNNNNNNDDDDDDDEKQLGDGGDEATNEDNLNGIDDQNSRENEEVIKKDDGHDYHMEGGTEEEQEHRTLLSVLDSEGRECSCVMMPTVELFSKADKHGLTLESNDCEAALESPPRRACKPSEVYSFGSYSESVMGPKRVSTVLKNLHLKKTWHQNDSADPKDCVPTNRYYKPFSNTLRKALSMD